MGTRKNSTRDINEALKQCEKRFRTFIDLSSERYWEQDENCRFTLASGSTSEHAIDPTSLVGTFRWDRGAVPVGDGGSWDKHKAVLQARQPFADFLFKRFDSKGELRYISASGKPVFDDKRRFCGYHGIAKDVTREKREELLLRLEHAVNRSLAEADSASAALREVIHAVCETEGWDGGVYFRLDAHANLLRLSPEECWSIEDPAVKRYIGGMRVVISPGVGLAGRVWHSGQALWVTDLGTDARATRSKLARETGMHGSFVFPVISEGKTISVLAFFSRELRHPEERLLQAIHVIGSQLGQFVQRKRAEELVRENARRFRALIENSSDAVALFDGDGKVVYGSPATVRVLGYAHGELGKRKHLELIHPDDLPAWRTFLKEAQEKPDDMVAFQARVRHKNGSWRVLDGVIHNLLHDPAIHAVVMNYHDVTESKRAELALRESEERFRSLTQLSSDMYWEQDDQYRFTSIAGSGLERVKARDFEFIGKKRWEQDWLNMSADDWAAHMAILEAHRPFHDLELCRQNESGKKVWVAVSGEPVFDASGAFKGYRGVGKDISERKQDEERIQHLANHDALTSLPNRAMFSEVLKLALRNARRYNGTFAVLFIDLDRFKIINDTLGHEVGDKLLQEMGTRLSQTVRTSDVVARLGGDEFVVLVREVSEPKQVEAIARKILSVLIEPMFIREQECRVTASIGICMYPADAQDEQSLMKNADIAMYRAKEEGKNTYKYYSEETNVHSFERMALETSLRQGLERKEFFLHYQPKLGLQSGQISGVEALVRWQHPELGMVPPAQFIPLGEETGLIVPIGKWVLNTACAQNVAWQREGLPPLRMAVNLSARQFADEDLLKHIAGALEQSGMKPELLEMELTESMVMQNAERADKVLAAIKQLGVRLAIDDFGVGYSSLANLKRFPIDTLKVDRSFIRDIPRDSEDKAITRAIIAMGKSLNLTVVAEGVETLEQETFLREHGCDETQGYYFSKPVAGDQFAELLRRNIEQPRK